VLFVTLVVRRRLDEVGATDAGSFVARASLRGQTPPLQRLALSGVVLVAALLLPLALDLSGLRRAQEMLALAIIFLSIVAVTGFSGHVTLGQAGFAGFGAFMAGRLHNGGLLFLGEVPMLAAMLLAAALCVPLGLAVGYPALRRKGLFLGLTTLALGLVLERFVFNNFQLTAGRLSIERPALPGVSLEGELAFYYFGVGLVLAAVALTRNLRSGRLGRILGAMRDSEAGAQAIGISLRNYKLFIFSASAFMAGLGGALLSQTARTFDPEQFITFNSLIWFAVVVVCGVTTIWGALLGAFVYTMLGALLGDAGISVLLIGLLALALGRLPGGLVGLLRGRGRSPSTTTEAVTERLEPSPLARHLLAEAEARP
jgi:branched-chain amino acid transport system permease protein